ncbi:carboxypeptidase regulatory-like domain-containing protein [Marnyiella aurantia]|uniref:Carboxypeptidase regulatory-like domain-containing protein n=1 Tax=Marnyiella aurantia TaxID=2758037 RepID=A0A7D7RI34_9FLAO|nr:carboxypeptidase regulatory-like domain-containing protein [Marnyiella aurantia]MBA5247075.1 carboxypeptidase regulatory-like domain-containing protein [Marnyiella aurantia]QMS97592.1 carboxypeptidase regulatory-like domain-containing protein [Marnyiella aurantia]
MKTKFLIFLLFCCSVITFAQKTISGKIKNSDGEFVPSASVTVEEKGKDAIIAYAITNSKGEYKVTFTSAESDVDLKIKAFNHKPVTRSVQNTSQNLDFTLDTEATEIKEIQLKTRLITKRGDTISYDIQSFDSKNDRTLADVLKRMPGIEVNKDGSILYQGQPLSKFYVNGKDLMEGGYGVVNNALPKDAVQKVEVLENHQPVKILQDKVPSDQAAINIKLKKQVTMTGRGEVGVGISDPAIWNVKLTPMFFGQKNQWVVNYKTNNTGETVENEGNMFAMGNRWEGRRSNASQNSWLSVERAAVPNLPEKRYLMNNIHFLSANLLTSPFKNKEWELKANASYVNNAVERESYEETFFKKENFTEFNIRDNNLYTNKAKGEIIFTKNAKEGFFKNVTSFNQFWNEDRASINLKNSEDDLLNKNSRQTLSSPTGSFQNSLSTIIPLKSKMLNVMSYISYQDDNQLLRVTPGNYVFYPELVTGPGSVPVFNNIFADLPEVSQDFGMKTFEANHSATMGFTKKFWTFTPEIGFNYTGNSLNSEILEFANAPYNQRREDFSNDLRFREAVPYVGLGVNYKSEAWTVGIQLPVNYNMITAEDAGRSVNKDFDKITFEPSGFVQYSFASFWKAALSGNWNYNFATINDLYGGILMSRPTSFSAMNPDNPLSETESKRAGSRIEYRNPLNNLFFNVNYSLSQTDRNLIADIDRGIGFGIISYIEQDNQIVSNSQSAEIGKYFPKFKSNLSLSFRNSTTTSDNARGGEIFENKNSTQNLTFKLNNAYFSWMTLDYNFTTGWGKNSSTFGDSETGSFNHNLGLTVYPVENHSVTLNWDQLNYSSGDQNFKNGFYDLTYQYAWAAKKVDFELKWLNIANKKVFERVFDDAFTYSFERIRIRPSQFMVAVKFNFK